MNTDDLQRCFVGDVPTFYPWDWSTLHQQFGSNIVGSHLPSFFTANLGFPKTNLTMEKQAFRDVFPIENGGISSLPMLVFRLSASHGCDCVCVCACVCACCLVVGGWGGCQDVWSMANYHRLHLIWPGQEKKIVVLAPQEGLRRMRLREVDWTPSMRSLTWKAASKFLQTGMDNLMVEVQKAASLATNASIHAQQPLAASEVAAWGHGKKRHSQALWEARGETLQSLCAGHCRTNLSWCIQRCVIFRSRV